MSRMENKERNLLLRIEDLETTSNALRESVKQLKHQYDTEQIITRIMHEKRALKFLSLKRECIPLKEHHNELKTALKNLATLLRKEVEK